MKNRANSIQALVQNWSDVEKSIEAANNAAGTAREEQERYSQSLQGKIDSLKSSWQALSNTFLSSDFLKRLVEGLTGVLNAIDLISNAIGSFSTVLLSVGVVNLVKFFKHLD